MIAKKEIQKNLEQLNTRFNNSKLLREPHWYSKLAILELCGWIEVSLDDIAKTLAAKNIRKSHNLNQFDDFVSETYGFKYKNHFCKMLIQAIGITGLEKLEKLVGEKRKVQLESELGNLARMRDKLAHTYTRGVTLSVDAPSTTIDRFHRVYEALKEYELAIRKLP